MARPLSDPSTFPGNHIVSISQFTSPASVDYVCEVGELMSAIVERRGGCELLKHRVLANVFYEPSTRTSCSFASAMARLGGSVLQVSESTSSAVKGETLGDSVKALACYSDVVVLRHPAKGSAQEASLACPVPLLNAGDGVGEHPTQALLDYATIRRELGRVAGITVTLVGDLKNGRTVHSLARLLALCGVGKINYVAPREYGVIAVCDSCPLFSRACFPTPAPPLLTHHLPPSRTTAELSMPEAIRSEVAAAGIAQESFDTLDTVIPATDVLYVTRVQKERFADLGEYEALKLRYVVTAATLATAKQRMVVMHPLPRVGEIAEEVDADPRAAYFRQMRVGLYVRMALLALCLGVSKEQVQGVVAAL
jgi:carbamoyl-phosphate synthase/aspartate carbamoyltransferase